MILELWRLKRTLFRSLIQAHKSGNMIVLIDENQDNKELKIQCFCGLNVATLEKTKDGWAKVYTKTVSELLSETENEKEFILKIKYSTEVVSRENLVDSFYYFTLNILRFYGLTSKDIERLFSEIFSLDNEKDKRVSIGNISADDLWAD